MVTPAGLSNHGPTVYALREAAAALGISRNTLRRRIAAGQIRAEQVRRPQGFVWQVYLDGPHGSDHGSTGTVQRDGPGTVPEGSTVIPPPSDGLDAGLMRAEAMATYTRSLLEPLVTRMAEQESTIREQSQTIGKLTERLDHVTAELEALKASQSPRAAPGAAETPGMPQDPSTDHGAGGPGGPDASRTAPWWRRWLGTVSG